MEKQTVSRRIQTDPSAEPRLRYLFRLSRPQYWFYLATPVLLGVIYAADSMVELLSSAAIGFILYFSIPGSVFLYGVNDIFDVDTDEHNPRKMEDGREMVFQEDPVIIAIIGLCGVSSGMLLFVTDSVVALLVLAAWLFLSVEYSAPPLRLKSIPFVDSITNGLYVLPGVAVYVTIEGSLPPVAAVLGFWLWTMGYHTFVAVPDIEPDRTAGVRTLAVVLGVHWSLVYSCILWLAAAVVFFQVHPVAGAIFFIYPVMIVFIAWFDVDIRRAYWWFPTITAGVGVSLLAPGLWLLLT